MDFNIRNAVINNLKYEKSEDIKKEIMYSIGSKEEKILPGLGVLFEVLWKNVSDEKQNDFVEIIRNSMIIHKMK